MPKDFNIVDQNGDNIIINGRIPIDASPPDAPEDTIPIVITEFGNVNS